MEADDPFSQKRILIVVAHPDDEVIGLGAQLPRLAGRLHIVHATNGSPENPADAEREGFSTGAEYAYARRQELREAVALAGVREPDCNEIGLTDQRASYNLQHLTAAIVDIIAATRPDVILTHPYEGGHPDHDACAFAVHAAVRGQGGPAVWEFTSYHAGPYGMHTGEFLEGADGTDRIIRCDLTPEQQRLKRRMFDCFRTQQEILSAFSLETESFRPAPKYDFTLPPHSGQLFYEQFDWGVTGARWRELAAAALNSTGMSLNATHNS